MVVRFFNNIIYHIFIKFYRYLVKHNVIKIDFYYDVDFWGDVI